MRKIVYLSPPSPISVKSLERWMETSYLFGIQMLKVGEEESRKKSEANQKHCCFE